MPLIRLTDAELEALFTAARPLNPRDRDSFLQAVAAELGNESVLGPGIAHRVSTEIQLLASCCRGSQPGLLSKIRRARIGSLTQQSSWIYRSGNIW